MLIISALSYIQEIIEKYMTRKQLSRLEPSRYTDIAMSNEEIRHESAKGKIHYVLFELMTLKRKL